MDKIKIAVVGLGGVAQIVHLPMLSKMSSVEIAAVCDKDFSKAKNIAKKCNIKKAYRDIDELLDDGKDITALVISTQTFAHKDISIKCLEAGKDLLIERPIARDHKEAQAIVDAAKKHKRKIMVGMNNRFRHDVMLQRSFIRSKEIGDIFYVKAGWLKSPSSGQKWFIEKDKAGGGVVLDNGISMLDLGMWMLGFPELRSVSSINYSQNTKSVEDSNFTLIKFKNNATLTIEVSWSLLRDEFFYCNAFGKDGSCTINPLKVFKKMDGTLFNITPKNIKAPSNVFKNSYELELKEFVNMAKGSDKFISTGEEAVKVMQIIDAVYKSAKTGKEIIFK